MKPTTDIETLVREKANAVPDAELQREILVRVHMQAYYAKETHQLLKKHLGLYTALAWIYIILVLIGVGIVMTGGKL